VLNIPPSRLLAAISLTGLNYAALTLYDFIAFAYIGKTLSRWRVAAASFLAYAVANNVGFAMLSGASVRYRFYSRWGVTAEEFSRVMFSYVITFWLGLLALGGLSLAVTPFPAVPSTLIVPVGWSLAGISLAYLVATAVRRQPLRVGRFELPLPSTRIAFAQFMASILDWTLAGAVFYVLLPANGVPFVAVLGAFLAAQLLGLASHVPGGIGVFEGSIVLLLGRFFTSAFTLDQLLPSLIAWHACCPCGHPPLSRRGLAAADELPADGALRSCVGRAVPRLRRSASGRRCRFPARRPPPPGRLALLNRFAY
jgi:phosphatidylglycerol lysyltransferase